MQSDDVEAQEEAEPSTVISAKEINKIVKKIIKGADLDSDSCISFYEFRAVVMRSTSFLETFRLRSN